MGTEQGDALTMTVLAPLDPGIPTVVFDGNAALRLAVIDRRSLFALDSTWDQPGVYVLLGPVSEDGSFPAYVGKAPAGLRSRLSEHASKRGRDWWSRALLVVRDTTHGWHSGQVGWLEGRLFDLLDGASLARLDNGQRPKDESIPAYDRAALEAAVEPVAAMLRLLGYAPDALDETAPTSPSARRGRTTYALSVADLVGRGDLLPGERLTTTRSTLPGEATVNADGSVTMDGAVHPTLSAAGTALRGGGAVNGWELWAVEREGARVPLAAIRARAMRNESA
jgi:hypothetical protein